VEFGRVGGEDLDEVGKMRSPCKSKTPTTIIHCSLHLCTTLLIYGEDELNLEKIELLIANG